jgi:hypothetical protein
LSLKIIAVLVEYLSRDFESFDAEIVKLNWDENFRLRQPHMQGQIMNFKPGSRLEIVDPQTVRLVFPEPDGGALAKLSNMHIANRQFYREFGWGEKSGPPAAGPGRLQSAGRRQRAGAALRASDVGHRFGVLV